MSLNPVDPRFAGSDPTSQFWQDRTPRTRMPANPTLAARYPKQEIAIIRELPDDTDIRHVVLTLDEVYLFEVRRPSGLSGTFCNDIRKAIGAEVKRLGYLPMTDEELAHYA